MSAFLARVFGSYRALARALGSALSFRAGEPVGPSLGVWLLIACGVELFGLALWPRVPLAPWFGPAVLLGALAPVLSRLASLAPSRRRSAVEYGTVLAVFAWLTWHVWGFAIRGRIPIDTGDHQIMFERARAQVEALDAGRWLRWTNFQQGGDSLTDLYPFLVNLILYIVHALSKHGTPLIESYTIFVAVAWWIRLAATYTLARRFAGIPVALVLAVASGFDVGNDVWDGAWYGAVYWGMVHSNVALSAAMLAMATQIDLVRAFSPVRFVICALTVALTAFSHPLGIMVAGATTAAYVAAWFSARELRKETLWVVVASGLGLLLCAPWMLSFAFGQKQFGFSNAVGGIDLKEISNGLYSGISPNTSFRAWTGFVTVAVVGSLLTREPTLVGPALAALLFVLLPIMEMMIEAGTFGLMPGLLDGQQRRMLTVAKCVAMPSAAWLLQLAVGRYFVPSSLAVRRVVTRALFILVLLLGVGRLFALGGEQLLKDLRTQVDKGSGGRRERSHAGKDYDAVFDKVAKARVAEKSPTPFRVAIDWTNVLRHAAWGEGFTNKVPVVDYVNAAANFLRIRPRELSEQGFHDWNIRFYISDHKHAPFPNLTERFQRGRFTLYELDSYDDRFVVAPPGVKISGLRVGEGEITFDVRGAGTKGVDVTVRSAWYPRWRVTKGGSDLRAVEPHPGAKPGQEQIRVHVRDGRVALDCNGPMPGERPGYVLSLFALFGLAVLTPARGRARVLELFERGRLRIVPYVERLRARLNPRMANRRTLSVALGVLAALGLLVAYARSGRRDFLLSPPFLPGPAIRVGTATGEGKRCEYPALNGNYGCARGVSVYSTFGAIPFGDDTSEFPKLFAAVGVNYGNADDTVIRIAFSDVDTQNGRIDLRYQAADVGVEVRVNGRSVGKRRWAGYGVDRFDVPKGSRQTVELVLSPAARGSLNFARIR